ncbi:protein O-GlcNAcase [Actinoplanes sp. TRM 88003]|uniref:Protein O-GlcNAcase n=1 Tax=Paractinoplanes aksuensis TaxID=2939490 RepID=A0ABT1DLQ8_9ACTN|nr:beta-N-acetylglucosaminidase domain-containing protein [Actinoplanes aksuensis]MCO8271778.1 protein O-GlcNAcase [Actinoplanes aksuensis]
MIAVNRVPVGVIDAAKRTKRSRQERQAFMERLAADGLDFYLIGSRPEPNDRRAPLDLYGVGEEEVAHLARAARSAGIRLGISAFPDERAVESERQLSDIVDTLMKTPFMGDIDMLLLRFDGSPMSGRHLLVDTQVEITRAVAAAFRSQLRVAVCPTLYADDVSKVGISVSDRDDYRRTWSQVDGDVSIFWSGSTLMSEGIDHHSVAGITRQYRRKPALWYNFPVNDGQGYQAQLRLIPKIDDVRQNMNQLELIGFNPMKQLRLSEIPIISAARALRSDSEDWSAVTRQVCTETLGARLGETVWSSIGRLDPADEEWAATRSELTSALAGDDSPYAAELRQWLHEVQRGDKGGE